MRTISVSGIALGLIIGLAHPALAQRVPFERSFDQRGASSMSRRFGGRSTSRLAIRGGDGRRHCGRSRRVERAPDAPIARRIAARPPIDQSGNTIRFAIAVERHRPTGGHHHTRSGCLEG